MTRASFTLDTMHQARTWQQLSPGFAGTCRLASISAGTAADATQVEPRAPRVVLRRRSWCGTAAFLRDIQSAQTASPTRYEGAACATRRSYRHCSAAAARDRYHTHRGLSDGRDRVAALTSVRPRCARIPPPRRRSLLRRRRRRYFAPALAAAEPISAQPRHRRRRRTGDGVENWDALLAAGSDSFDVADTAAGDPAMIIYTSGTTGQPKGALIPHCALLGNLPGFVCSHDFFPQPGDMFWSPADWAWTGGLFDALLPTWHFGLPILALPGRFEPERALRSMEKYRVRNAFLFPTALKVMMKEIPEPRSRFDLTLRSLMSGGEAVGPAVMEWGAVQARCNDQ